MIAGVFVSISYYSQTQRIDFLLSLFMDLHRPPPLPGMGWAAVLRTLPAYSFPGTFHPAQRLFVDVNILKKRNNKMNKIALTIITIFAATGLVLSACVSQGNLAGLAGTSWKLISYGNVGNQAPAVPGVETSLIFGEDGQANGNLGCNGFSGGYEEKSGNIVFGPLASTLMACPEPQMTQEGTAFQVLTGMVRFELAGNTLTIYDASGAIAIALSQFENE